MRIVFMGTPEFAVPSLEILLKNNYPVVSVVTAPDSPKGRGLKIEESPVKRSALEHSLPILQPRNLNDPSFVSAIRSLHTDLIVVVAFRILPPEVYSLASRGAFNLHASLLPKYRGAAPIHWAIIRGETETGVTTFFLQPTVDTGSVILQARVKIGPDETAGELHDKLAEVGAEIVLQTVRLIEQNKAQARAQEGEVSLAPKIQKADCRVDWRKPASAVHNFVRGLSPVPGAWTTLRGAFIRVFRTLPTGQGFGDRAEPGVIVRADGSELIVATGEGSISLLEVQQESRRRMSAAEFLRGGRLREGEKFE